MIAATLTLPSSLPGSAAAIAGRSHDSEWCTLAEASRLIGRHVNAVKSIALAGGIRTRVVPGARILYSRPDAERLAAAG